MKTDQVRGWGWRGISWRHCKQAFAKFHLASTAYLCCVWAVPNGPTAPTCPDEKYGCSACVCVCVLRFVSSESCCRRYSVKTPIARSPSRPLQRICSGRITIRTCLSCCAHDIHRGLSQAHNVVTFSFEWPFPANGFLPIAFLSMLLPRRLLPGGLLLPLLFALFLLLLRRRLLLLLLLVRGYSSLRCLWVQADAVSDPAPLEADARSGPGSVTRRPKLFLCLEPRCVQGPAILPSLCSRILQDPSFRYATALEDT